MQGYIGMKNTNAVGIKWCLFNNLRKEGDDTGEAKKKKKREMSSKQ